MAIAAGVTAKVCSTAETQVGTIQVVDYQWDAGAEIIEFSTEPMLRLRLWPLRLDARGWVDADQTGSFGPLMLVPPNVEVHGRGAGNLEVARTVDCRFNLDWLSELAECDAGQVMADPASCLSLRNPNIEYGLRRLSEEVLDPKRSSSEMIKALITLIGVDFARLLSEQNRGGCTTDSKGTLSKSRLQFIQNYIKSFEDGSPNLSNVADACGFSVAHLRRIFKSTTGKTVYDYIEEVRMERAQKLLRDSPLQLKAIAYQLGYAHPSAFSSAFKKATGEAPGDYRARFSTSVETR
jgi:AraC family transcriptional regulator